MSKIVPDPSTTVLGTPPAVGQRAVNTNSVIYGQLDNEKYKATSVTPEGHLEVSVHDPTTLFGALDVSQDTPIYQSDFVYGINAVNNTTFLSGTGAANGTGQMAVLSTGTTVLSFAVLESRRRLRYRPGQGIKNIFTALYTSPVANSYQCAGCGTAENGLYFGYGNTNDLSDTSFGILYVRNGVREIKTLTVTTGATSASNVTITLNGVAFTVPVTASSNIQRTVWEIATYTGYTGWFAYANGATVVFIRQSSGTTAGTQSFSAGTTGSAASIAQTRAGVASTDTHIAQSDWNVDVMDGSMSNSNPSGVLLNPQTINIYRINIGYLGTHDIEFQVRITPADNNNPVWQTVHILKLQNLNTTTSFSNPSFPFNAFAYSAGSTTNLTVSIGSYLGSVEGKKILLGPRGIIEGASAGVTSSVYTTLCTIMNPRVFNSVSNQAVVKIAAVTGAVEHNNPVKFYLIKNGALVGNPSFSQYATGFCTLFDTAATSVPTPSNDQKQFTAQLGQTGDFNIRFTGEGDFNAEEFTMQPGEWFSLVAISLGVGSPSFVTGAIIIREDQ